MVDGCVPDILLTHNGRCIAILEMKFWAPLTDRQMYDYSRIAGLVVFVVPKERVDRLNAEVQALDTKSKLRVISWQSLLNQIEQTINETISADVHLLTGALAHLKEFCKVTEKLFVPLTMSQLSTPNDDSVADHLVWLTREVLTSAIRDGIILEALNPRAGYDSSFFYGQNVSIGGARVWFGYWPKAWKKWPADGPLWIQVYGREAIALFRAAYPDARRIPDGDLAVPMFRIGTASEATQEHEVEVILEAVKEFAIRLKSPSEPPGVAGAN